MIDAPKIHNVLYLVAALSWSVKDTDALIGVHYRVYANVCVATSQCKGEDLWQRRAPGDDIWG